MDFGDLLHEARLLASLNHPNIVSVLTAEKQENVFFIVMEYVPSVTLELMISRDGKIDLPRALDFTCQICNALDHAHQQGVIHRDLRPGNVLVTDTGVLKVVDFGTSRFIERAAHGTTVIGSPPYMAPEQFQGKAVLASDIYSLGVTMYQMLTGVLPYNTPQPGDIEKLIKGGMVSPPRTRNPKIPAKISEIVMKAVAPDIGARYQRASDLLADLLSHRAPPHDARRDTTNPAAGPCRAAARTARCGRLGRPIACAGNAAAALLLALPQASAGAIDALPVLWRRTVDANLQLEAQLTLWLLRARAKSG